MKKRNREKSDFNYESLSESESGSLSDSEDESHPAAPSESCSSILLQQLTNRLQYLFGDIIKLLCVINIGLSDIRFHGIYEGISCSWILDMLTENFLNLF